MGGLQLEFACAGTGTPAHDRQDLALSDRYDRQFDPRLLIDYSQLTYTHIYTRAYIYIYTSIGHPTIRHLPTGHNTAASYLLNLDLKI